MQDNKQERFPIVDEEGRVVGSATRGECHNGSRLLHPVVHLHVFNTRGEVYLQKRPQWKDIQPGKWDTSVGGHMDYGRRPFLDARRDSCSHRLQYSYAQLRERVPAILLVAVSPLRGLPSAFQEPGKAGQGMKCPSCRSGCRQAS